MTNGVWDNRAAAALLVAALLTVAPGCGGSEGRKAKALDKGQAYLAEREYAKARVEFRNALQIDGKDAAARTLLGEAAEALGNYEEAIQNYRYALSLDAGQVKSRARLARMMVCGGVPEQALELVAPGLETNPKSADLLTVRAAAQLQQGQVEAARADAEAALASLTSFDSVFFIYAWLIGWDLLEKRGFRWRTYLVFALAPISAHGLQFLQNVWYLGWNDAVTDIKDAFLLKHGADQGYNTGQGRLAVIITSIVILFSNLYQPTSLLVAVLAAYGVYLLFLRKGDPEMPSAGLLLVLFLCGRAFVLVLPHAARMPYEARQMTPFAALAAGGFFWSC